MSYELLKEEYVALRSEICQSIAKQHQITIGGYAATAAAIGYIVGADHVSLKGLVAIPAILTAMTALWVVECNRMVRAGFYIGYVLWPEIKRVSEYEGLISWDQWIKENDERIPRGFRRRQDIAQQIVTVLIPSLASTSALVALYMYESDWRMITVAAFGATGLGWFFLWLYFVRPVSDLSNTRK